MKTISSTVQILHSRLSSESSDVQGRVTQETKNAQTIWDSRKSLETQHIKESENIVLDTNDPHKLAFNTS